MDQYIKQSIQSRKEAIFNAYEVGADGKKKIEALFTEIEKLGAKCKDVGEFESEFASSPLNQKYLDLFTEIATSMPAKGGAGAKAGTNGESKGKTIGKMVAGGVATGVADRAVNQAAQAVLPTRAAVRQKASDELRKVPVLGDALDIGQKASYAAHLGKLFGGRKKKQK